LAGVQLDHFREALPASHPVSLSAANDQPPATRDRDYRVREYKPRWASDMAVVKDRRVLVRGYPNLRRPNMNFTLGADLPVNGAACGTQTQCQPRGQVPVCGSAVWGCLARKSREHPRGDQ
jgi:hypothetical protein